MAIITPFNFPLEIPVLQLMGALYMGNKPVLKVDSKVSSFGSDFGILFDITSNTKLIQGLLLGCMKY